MFVRLSRVVSIEAIAPLIAGRIGKARVTVGHGALPHVRIGMSGVRHHRPVPMARPARPARSQMDLAGACVASTRVNSAEHAAARCSPQCDKLGVAGSSSHTTLEPAGMRSPPKSHPAPTSQAAGNPENLRSVAANRPCGATPPASRTPGNQRQANPPEPRDVHAPGRKAACGTRVSTKKTQCLGVGRVATLKRRRYKNPNILYRA